MTIRRTSARIAIGVVVIAAVTALLVWGFVSGRQEAAAERERERPVPTPQRVSTFAGRTVVQLDAATQARIGLAIAPVKEITQDQEIRGHGAVVDVSSLADQRNKYVAATTEVEKARAAVEAAQRAYDRLKILYDDNQNVSAKVLDAAAAARTSAHATLEAAQSPVRTIDATTEQQWGPVMSRWVAQGSPEFARLLARRDVLVQITLAPDVYLPTPPREAFVQVAGGPRRRASFVSVTPRTDPQVQGLSFYYLAAAAPELQQGMNLLATLPLAARARGTLVPSEAIVWSGGKAWAYLQDAPDRFSRREVPTDRPAAGGEGYLTGFPAASPVVVRGAQTLLSEEFRAQIQLAVEQ